MTPQSIRHDSDLQKRRLKRVAWSVAAAAVLALVVWLKHDVPDENGPREGAPAPELGMTDLSGQTVSWSQYRGKVVLLDFWATWCDSCRAELPDLERMHERLHPRGFDLLAASVDGGRRQALMAFIAQNGIPWRVLLSDDLKTRAYGVYGLPTKYLVDQDGIIVRKFVGPVDPQVLETDIDALLKKSPPRLPNG